MNPICLWKKLVIVIAFVSLAVVVLGIHSAQAQSAANKLIDKRISISVEHYTILQGNAQAVPLWALRFL